MGRMGRTAAAGALLRALRGSMRAGEPGVTERLRAVPRLVRATLSGDYTGTSKGRLVLLASAVLYIVSPVDVLPEVLIPFLGLADDAVVVAWLAGQLLGETETFLGWERSARPAEPSGRRRRGATGGPQVVKGQVIR